MTAQAERTSVPAVQSAVRSDTPLTLPRTFSIDEVGRIANAFAQSGFFKDAKSVAQAFTKILAGQELGIGPMTSMAMIHIVEGKPTMDATLVAAQIKKSGRYDYRIRQWDGSACNIEFFERGESVGFSAFTLEDAKTAGLAHKDVWKKYSRNMLRARALTNGARLYCPDVFNGAIYTPDEVGAEVAMNAQGELQVLESARDGAGMSDLTSRRLFAMLGERGIRAKADRLAFAHAQGYEITSYTQLDEDDARALIAALEKLPPQAAIPPAQDPAAVEPRAPEIAEGELLPAEPAQPQSTARRSAGDPGSVSIETLGKLTRAFAVLGLNAKEQSAILDGATSGRVTDPDRLRDLSENEARRLGKSLAESTCEICGMRPLIEKHKADGSGVPCPNDASPEAVAWRAEYDGVGGGA